MAQIYRKNSRRQRIQVRSEEPILPPAPVPKPKPKPKPKVDNTVNKDPKAEVFGPLKPIKVRSKKPFIVVGVVLAVLLMGLILQAVIANRNIKSATESSEKRLKDMIVQTTADMQRLNIEGPNDQAVALKELSSLITNSDQISDTCKKQHRPIINAFAPGYEATYDRCQNMAASARSIKQAADVLQPLAVYHIELQKAMQPVVLLQRSDDRADPKKNHEAWQSTRDTLRKVKAPTPLDGNNKRILAALGDIITSLEVVVGEVSPSYTQLQAAEKELAEHYKKLAQESTGLQKELDAAQTRLTNAAKSVR